jgi:hypothetical protein
MKLNTLLRICEIILNVPPFFARLEDMEAVTTQPEGRRFDVALKMAE